MNKFDSTLQINAQVYENGKPIGGQVFEMQVDSDSFLNDEEKSLKIIQTLLDEKTSATGIIKYLYMSHELIFKTPIQLDGKLFASRIATA